jgi:hypothetical protein
MCPKKNPCLELQRRHSRVPLGHHWPCANGAVTGQLPSTTNVLLFRHHWPCASGTMTDWLARLVIVCAVSFYWGKLDMLDSESFVFVGLLKVRCHF